MRACCVRVREVRAEAGEVYISGDTMSILAYNGAAVIAMTGKDCVAIASDLRFGLQQTTQATDFR